MLGCLLDKGALEMDNGVVEKTRGLVLKWGHYGACRRYQTNYDDPFADVKIVDN